MKHTFRYILSTVLLLIPVLASAQTTDPAIYTGYNIKNGVATGKSVGDPDANGVYTVTLETFATGMETIGKFFTDQNFVQAFDELQGLGLILPDVIVIAIATVFLFIISLIQERHADTNIRTMLDSKPFILRFILIYLGVMAVIIFGIYGSGYSAADFVYMQF